MKKYPRPAQFDGGKFAKRYGLDPLKSEFHADENFIYVEKAIPDDPPIFEAPDAPPPPLTTRLDAVKTLPELIELLKKELPNG